MMSPPLVLSQLILPRFSLWTLVLSHSSNKRIVQLNKGCEWIGNAFLSENDNGR